MQFILIIDIIFFDLVFLIDYADYFLTYGNIRSEERRVGKECA